MFLLDLLFSLFAPSPQGLILQQLKTVAWIVLSAGVLYVLLKRNGSHVLRTREATQQGEERFRALVDNAPDNILLLNREGVIQYVSPSIEPILGCTPHELEHADLPDLIHPEDLEAARKAFRDIVAAPGAAHSLQFRIRHADKSWRFIEAVGQNLLNNPAVGAIVVNSRDVTETKRAQRKVVLLAAALDAAANGVLITDHTGTILAVNPAFCAMTGYSPAEIIGKNPRILKSEEHGEAFFRALWETILAGRVWRGQMVNRRKDGSLYYEEQTITPLRLDTPHISHFISIRTDVSERKQADERLIHLDKMEALGRLAVGIVHDFNNLLTGISGYSQLVMQELAPASPASKDMNEILQAVGRASKLTKTLLSFTGNQEFQFRILELNALVTQAEEVLRHSVSKDVQLLIELDPNAGAVSVDASQMEHVLTNLVINASDALPKGGRIIIQTFRADIQEPIRHPHGEIPRGLYGVISISDTGTGMDEEVQSHIFEPFFTTKERDRGTGLGLAIVYGTVRQSSGYVQVISHPNLGTKFMIYLPRVEGGKR